MIVVHDVFETKFDCIMYSTNKNTITNGSSADTNDKFQRLLNKIGLLQSKIVEMNDKIDSIIGNSNIKCLCDRIIDSIMISCHHIIKNIKKKKI